MARSFELGWIVSSVLLIAACRGGEPAAEPEGSSANAPPRSTTQATSSEALEVPIAARSGSALRGKATFTELDGGGVRVVVDVTGVEPGKHGVHVHEKGDCSAPDATSAGDHFNPEGHPHALPASEPRHVGDLGNIEVGEDGSGHLDIVAPHGTLRAGDARSFLGRAIIVHAKSDDGSQPSGAAGARIGCGEIRG